MVEGERYAVVSCHVERPLDDETWRRFAALQEQRPGGFAVAALLRPADTAAGEDPQRWAVRAREAAQRGPVGLHTHWTSPAHARPAGGADPAERVRADAGTVLAAGVRPTLFCGGGWYMDEAVAEAVASLGLVDCTATAFRPRTLARDAARLGLDRPGRLVLPSGARLLELPSTHSPGMLARAVFRRRLGAPVVHAYLHDTDLLDGRRRLALEWALRVLGRRRAPLGLDELARRCADAPEQDFAAAFASSA